MLDSIYHMTLKSLFGMKIRICHLKHNIIMDVTKSVNP